MGTVSIDSINELKEGWKMSCQQQYWMAVMSILMWFWKRERKSEMRVSGAHPGATCLLFCIKERNVKSKQALLLELHEHWKPDRDNYYLNTDCLYYTSHSETWRHLHLFFGEKKIQVLSSSMLVYQMRSVPLFSAERGDYGQGLDNYLPSRDPTAPLPAMMLTGCHGELW